MEKRYACFELITKCNSCGNPVPITGPFQKTVCPSCFNDVQVHSESFADFFNSFDEEYSSLDHGQGSGGTVIGGRGSFEYAYWRLEPRCSDCKNKFPEHDSKTEGKFNCPKCGKEYYVFPASKEIQELSPSVTQFITFEKVNGKDDKSTVNPDESKQSLVVMSCPKCGGAVTVTEMSERIMKCEYCTTEVYVPDAVWKRLHPVKQKVEWFVKLEGKTIAQTAAARRRRDLIEERAELKERKTKQRFNLKKKKPFIRYLAVGIPAFLIALGLLVSLMKLFNYSQEQIDEIVGTIFTVVFITFFVFLTLAGALHAFWGFWFGKQGKCKKAMDALALKHAWKFEGGNYVASMGYINAKFKGRDIEINPNDDYAIEVDINDSPLYLKTEQPAYPGDELYRFTTGNKRFDEIFPIRYAKPRIVKKIESSDTFRAQLLKPFDWFFDRWEKQLAVAKLDWSTFEVHLNPGHAKTDFSAGRYLLPNQIEPLLEDMCTFANALEKVLQGKEPELPFM
jgi:predicted RNA-binding Zn-ribbon protein involved in translation (DUF1610 family)